MRSSVFFTTFLLSFLFSYAQDAKKIMHSSFFKCQTIRHGYYEMSKGMKFMSGRDTLHTAFNCTFRKLPDDTLFGIAFNYQGFYKGRYTGEFIYTGKDLAKISATDSSAEIMSTERFAGEIAASNRNYTFYSPLTSRDSWPMKHDSDIIDPLQTFVLKAEELINGKLCYHILVREIPKNKGTASTHDLQYTFDYWINKKDLIPVQYSMAFDVVVNNDTLHQFEKFTLNKYEINESGGLSALSLNSIPTSYKVFGYRPAYSPEPLPIDTLAPTLELTTLQGEKIKTKELKGKMILLGFFFTSSYPSSRTYSVLQKLHTNYAEKGLKVIGIDPIDVVAGEVSGFLNKQGITYPVSLNGKEAAATFRVSIYPTLYLINQKGKIIYVKMNMGPHSEKILEDLIRLNL